MIFGVFVANAQESNSKPWYSSVDKIEEIEIFISFEDSNSTIDPVYNFHLRSMALFLQNDNSLRIDIYKKKGDLSNYRAKAIKNFLEEVLKAPSDSISVLSSEILGLPLNKENASEKIEKIKVVLSKSVDIEGGDSLYRDVVVLEEAPQKKRVKKTDLLVEYGVVNSISDFIGEFDPYALGPILRLTFNAENKLRYFIDGRASFYLSEDFQSEVFFNTGLEYIYRVIESSTKLYFQKNLIQNSLNMNFQSYEDIGIGQDINLNVIKYRDYKYQIGAFAKFSFSNNSEELQNSNVLIYGVQNTLRLPSRFKFRIELSKRKLRELQDFPGSNEHINFVLSHEY